MVGEAERQNAKGRRDCEETRRPDDVMDKREVVTYGQSAWCEPLLMSCLMKEVVRRVVG